MWRIGLYQGQYESQDGSSISVHTIQVFSNTKVVHEWPAPDAEKEDLGDEPAKDDISKDDLDLKLTLESRSMQRLLANAHLMTKQAMHT